MKSVAERFFSNTKVNHFLLEYDTERAGDFQPLRFVKGKGVVLGLISSKTPVLESLDDLKRRTEEATQFIDLDRLAISPQCGFASTVAGNPVTEADEHAKLKLVSIRQKQSGSKSSPQLLRNRRSSFFDNRAVQIQVPSHAIHVHLVAGLGRDAEWRTNVPL